MMCLVTFVYFTTDRVLFPSNTLKSINYPRLNIICLSPPKIAVMETFRKCVKEDFTYRFNLSDFVED